LCMKPCYGKSINLNIRKNPYMEPTRTQLPIIEQVKAYLETKFKLLKYEGIDKASAIIAEVVTDLVIALLLLITFIFFSTTLALFAAELLHSAWGRFWVCYAAVCIDCTLRTIAPGAFANIFIRRMIEKLFRKRND